ncbi:MAG: amidohydrolase family protein [bacterium]
MPLVIDTHVHLIAIAESNGAFMSPKLKKNPLFKIFIGKKYGWKGDDELFDRNYAEIVARTVRESKTTDRAVLLALDGIYDNQGKLDYARTHAYVPNDHCRKVCDMYPEFLFGPSVNPNRADALDELDRVKSLGAVLIKWLSPSQDFDPSEKKYMPFYKKLVSLKLPLLSHTGYEHSVPVTNQLLGDPQLLVPALQEGVTIIAGHAGTSGHGHPVEFFGTYLEMLDRYPNLYGDLAAVTGITRFGYIAKMLKRSGFMDRHIHATDYPAPPMALLFPRKLGARKLAKISFTKNLFDKDVEIKRALGFPETVFHKAAELLGIQ